MESASTPSEEAASEPEQFFIGTGAVLQVVGRQLNDDIMRRLIGSDTRRLIHTLSVVNDVWLINIVMKVMREEMTFWLGLVEHRHRELCIEIGMGL